MAGLGRKQWSPGDTLTASDVNGYLMDQSVMVFAGTAARASAIPTPSAGMVAYSTATSLQVYNGSTWVDLSTGYGVATGGTALATPPTGYAGMVFTADGTLTVTKAGLFDVLLYGGGGGGAGNQNFNARCGGGGGGGGKLESTIYLEATTYSVVIGAGGAGGAPLTAGTNGGYTGIGSVIALPGGGGAPTLSTKGRGSTGGGTWATSGVTSTSLFTPSTDFGRDGGLNSGDYAGGGGGAVGVGGAASGSTGGTGGTGFDIATFTGNASSVKGGGGGGGGATGGTGSGGGANGGGTSVAGFSAAANSAGGGGGGGAGNTTAVSGGNGGSGICYIRWKA